MSCPALMSMTLLIQTAIAAWNSGDLGPAEASHEPRAIHGLRGLRLEPILCAPAPWSLCVEANPIGSTHSAGDNAKTPRRKDAMAGAAADTVVLLHGLGRSRLSMQWLARQFAKAGYNVVNEGYPSTRLDIAEAADHLHQKLAPQLSSAPGQVHFVTHSLGGVVVRALLQSHRPTNLGRVVMLGPPSQGSEVVDRLARNPIYRWTTGPAGQELGTGPTSTPNLLGPVDFEVGVIAGRSSLNPLFSSWLKGPNDGKVSVTKAAVPGLTDLFVVARSHTYLMRSGEVARQALHFIAHGRFDRPTA